MVRGAVVSTASVVDDESSSTRTSYQLLALNPGRSATRPVAGNLTAYFTLTKPITLGEPTGFVDIGKRIGLSPSDTVEPVYGIEDGQDKADFSGIVFVEDPAAAGSRVEPIKVDRATVDRLITLIDGIRICR